MGALEYGDVPAGDYALVVEHTRMNITAISKLERGRPLLLRPDR